MAGPAPRRYQSAVIGCRSAALRTSHTRAARCVLARRLSEVRDWRVLVLEAGAEEPPETSVPSFFTHGIVSDTARVSVTRPQKNGAAPLGTLSVRGNVLGGTSAINGVIYTRGNKEDYRRLEHLGWGYGTVLPYFKKAEDNLDEDVASDTEHHGTGGPLSVQRLPYRDPSAVLIKTALLEQGFDDVHDINGASQLGPTNRTSAFYYQTTTRHGRRMSTNRSDRFTAPSASPRTTPDPTSSCRRLAWP
ncbi:hypothetical protein FOCC_FOCC003149 [Frankliniella occidentalis]|nr:hypothetical protein FOCC_FOCC003149 [Frankliniella occidentalis]